MKTPENALAERVYVLTIRNPWAWAIVYAGKDVENRTWTITTPCTLLIHAGRTFGPAERTAVEHLQHMGIMLPYELLLGNFHNGHIIGKAVVTECGWTSDSRWATPGTYHWELKDVVPIRTPLLVTGRAGLFKPPAGWQEAF